MCPAPVNDEQSGEVGFILLSHQRSLSDPSPVLSAVLLSALLQEGRSPVGRG